MFALHYLEIIEGSGITSIEKCSREIGSNRPLQYFFICIFLFILPFKIGLVSPSFQKKTALQIIEHMLSLKYSKTYLILSIDSTAQQTTAHLPLTAQHYGTTALHSA